MHPPFGGASLELRQTVKAVTPFGGLAIFAQFLERVGWSQVVSAHMPVHYSSPNAIDPSQTLTAFMISVIAGAKRFAHGSFLRADRALQAIFGLSRFPGDDAVRSFFGRFDAGKIEQFWKPIWGWLLERVPARREGYTLDLDKYCLRALQPSARGGARYNPGRRGGRSHHPLLAVLSEACFVLLRLAAARHDQCE